MAFEDDDKELLKLLIETSMNRAMKPIADEITEHTLTIQKLNQTVYGENGDNGMRKTVKENSEKIEIIETRQNKIIAYASAATTAITIGGAMFGEKIKKMIGL